MSAICSWNDIKTVLLDVDGTLLDLHFDNSVWDNSLPEAFATKHNLSMSESRSNLYAHMRKVRGKIEFYSFDYWSSFTNIDIEKLHELSKEKLLLEKMPSGSCPKSALRKPLLLQPTQTENRLG